MSHQAQQALARHPSLSPRSASLSSSSSSMPSTSTRTSPEPSLSPAAPGPAMAALLAASPSASALDEGIPFSATLPGELSPSLGAGLDGAAGLLGGIAQDSSADADPQILEALRNKDRLYVLKLGEIMESLIVERKQRVDLQPTTSYQRLLVYRCAAYYKCTCEGDPNNSKGLVVVAAAESRMPSRRLADLVPIEATAQPAFKIMRRSSRDRMKARAHSQAGSTAGEDADLSDIEPSEAGSLSSRGNRKHRTIEEREAAYEQARSRIFMDFAEKEKEKGTSATSSTFSLVSGSTSTSAGGSSGVEDLDDSVTTESEWSAPANGERKTGRRGGSGSNSAVSTRSWRATTFQSAGSSSRGSRAPSPSSFTYPSLYEPPPVAYDAAQQTGQPPPPGYIHYGYPYAPPPGQGPGQPYMAPYPFYPSYGYPPQLQHHHSDPTSPGASDMYSPPPHHMAQQMYHSPYPWAPPTGAPPNPGHPTSPPIQNPSHAVPPQIPAGHGLPHYPSAYMPPPAGYMPYAMPGYYPPPPPPASQHMSPPPQMVGQPMYSMEPPRPMNGNGVGAGNGGGPSHSRTSSRNSSQGSKRNAPPARSAWSYGPGPSTGGYSHGGVGGNDAVGPRLSASMRRGSNTSSVGSGSTGMRTPGGDEASSTASSSTSSSSIRTFTSTSTSSKHPLPARPDWAIGLRPESTTHRHNEPPRGRDNGPGPNPSQQRPQGPPQSTDFPPLSSTVASPPRVPVAGAWTNSSSTRSILTSTAPPASAPGNALVQYPNAQGQGQSPGAAGAPRTAEEQDRTFERPPPKGNAELFNPKGGARRANGGGGSGGKGATSPDGSFRLDRRVEEAALVERMGAMNMSGSKLESPMEGAAAGEAGQFGAIYAS